jgi:hypothetical protein
LRQDLGINIAHAGIQPANLAHIRNTWVLGLIAGMHNLGTLNVISNLPSSKAHTLFFIDLWKLVFTFPNGIVHPYVPNSNNVFQNKHSKMFNE